MSRRNGRGSKSESRCQAQADDVDEHSQHAPAATPSPTPGRSPPQHLLLHISISATRDTATRQQSARRGHARETCCPANRDLPPPPPMTQSRSLPLHAAMLPHSGTSDATHLISEKLTLLPVRRFLPPKRPRCERRNTSPPRTQAPASNRDACSDARATHRQQRNTCTRNPRGRGGGGGGDCRTIPKCGPEHVNRERRGCGH
jgi:hypothetical protein